MPSGICVVGQEHTPAGATANIILWLIIARQHLGGALLKPMAIKRERIAVINITGGVYRDARPVRDDPGGLLFATGMMICDFQTTFDMKLSFRGQCTGRKQFVVVDAEPANLLVLPRRNRQVINQESLFIKPVKNQSREKMPKRAF